MFELCKGTLLHDRVDLPKILRRCQQQITHPDAKVARVRVDGKQMYYRVGPGNNFVKVFFGKKFMTISNGFQKMALSHVSI